MLPNDTTAAAAAAQVAAYRRMSGDTRVRIAVQMSNDARAIALAGIRRRHPEYTAAQVLAELYKILHGEEQYRQVWANRRPARQ